MSDAEKSTKLWRKRLWFTLCILGIPLAAVGLWQLLVPDVYYAISARNYTNEGINIYSAH